MPKNRKKLYTKTFRLIRWRRNKGYGEGRKKEERRSKEEMRGGVVLW